MKKTLYLMRHGETLFNAQKKNQGWSDSPLTPRGIEQAREAGRYLRENKITFDSAYSSTSERACDTLEIVTDGKMPYTRVKGLREWGFGLFEGQDIFLHPRYPYHDFFAPFGGESEKEAVERITGTIAGIMEREEHQNILMVSHGIATKVFLLAWEDYNQIGRVWFLDNCGILRYEYEDGIFRLTDVYNEKPRA